jgi:hypothetical protein
MLKVLVGGTPEGEPVWLHLVPNLMDPQSWTLFGVLAVPRALQAPATAGRTPASSLLARPAAAASGEEGEAGGGAPRRAARPPLAWADEAGEGVAAGAASLELAAGAHYAAPGPRALLASRSPAPPRIRSFAAGGGAEEEDRPLLHLRVALLGVSKRSQVGSQQRRTPAHGLQPPLPAPLPCCLRVRGGEYAVSSPASLPPA